MAWALQYTTARHHQPTICHEHHAMIGGPITRRVCVALCGAEMDDSCPRTACSASVACAPPACPSHHSAATAHLAITSAARSPAPPCPPPPAPRCVTSRQLVASGETARKHPQPRRPPNIFVVHRLSSSASASPVRRPFPRSSSRVVAFLPLHHPATSIVLSASRSAFPFLHHQHPPGEHLIHT